MVCCLEHVVWNIRQKQLFQESDLQIWKALCAHSPCIEGYHFFFYPGDVPLVFWDQLWLELTPTVSRDIDLKLTILAFQCFRGMPVSLFGCLELFFLIFFITDGSIQFRFHELLQDVFEAVAEQSVDIRHTA